MTRQTGLLATSSVARASSTDPKTEADACPSHPHTQDPGADSRSRVSLVGESGVHGRKARHDMHSILRVASCAWSECIAMLVPRHSSRPYSSIVVRQWLMVWTLNMGSRYSASARPVNFILSTGILTTVGTYLLMLPLLEPRGAKQPCTCLGGERSGNLQGVKHVVLCPPTNTAGHGPAVGQVLECVEKR